MRQLVQARFLFYTLLFGISGFAQDIIAETGSYGVDKKNKIIVWHQNNLDSLTAASSTITSIKFGETFTIQETSKPLSYTKSNNVTNGDDYALYISKTPLVHITINTSAINRNAKIPGYFTYYGNKEYIETVMGVRHRGNLSLTFPKKSFDLEFWTDSISKKKKNVKFKNMRNDDDWILDGMYNEPLHLRSHIAAGLWSEIHKPYYLQKELKAKSGFRVQYVEVFKNKEYYGIYQFSESIDRKQLRIKKHINDSVYGELYKANSYKGGPDFIKVTKYNNLFPHWNGWLTRYPFIDYKSDWKNLSALSNLVVNGNDDLFSQTIENKVHIANVIDYYLFINMLRASDNMGKNYYLGKYDKSEPYFFIPWDLDGVLGIIQYGKREWVTNDVLGNGLFNRLLELNPNDYKDKVKNRWIALRGDVFSNTSLFSKIDKIYDTFTKEKVYEREQRVWKSKLNDVSNADHYNHLKTWLEDRLIFLDAHFKSL